MNNKCKNSVFVLFFIVAFFNLLYLKGDSPIDLSKDEIKFIFQQYYKKYGDIENFPITSDQIALLKLTDVNVKHINGLVEDFYKRYKAKKSTVLEEKSENEFFLAAINEIYEEIDNAVTERFSDSEPAQIVAWARWGYAYLIILYAFDSGNE